MLHRIKSPFLNKENYNCVACSPNNPNGLKLEFFENGDGVETVFRPDRNVEGWFDTVHGGIQSLIADEVSAWLVMRKLQTSGVTTKLEVRFLKPALISQSPLTAHAVLKEQKRNMAFIDVEIRNAQNELCTKAEVIYYCWSKEKAAEEFGFKGCVLDR